MSKEVLHGFAAAKGFVYGMKNKSMPGLMKYGHTFLDPRIRAKKLQSTGVPTPFEIIVAKMVDNPIDIEKGIHLILNTSRVSENREFFISTEEQANKLFDLIEGEWWDPRVEINEDEDDDEDETEDVPIPTKGCRIMSKCFTDKQAIRHITRGDIWEGVYDRKADSILYEGTSYGSLCKFANAHNRIFNPDRTCNGAWDKCQCFVDGQWISTYNLPDLTA
jgi:hypothetical protein